MTLVTGVVDVVDLRGRQWQSASHSVSLVVPLYDEEERLAENGVMLGEFVAGYASGSELILVDDGSGDATLAVASSLARRLPVETRIVSGPHQGKGAAVRAGLEIARASVAAFCDVDLSTPLDELGRIIAAAASGPILAIGSRDVVAPREAGTEGELRELLGTAFNWLLRLTITPGVYDTQCGAKAAHRAVWREILPYCSENGFCWDAEAIAVGRRRGVAVWEVGVAWRHDERTRVRPLRDGLQMVASVPRILARVSRTPALGALPLGLCDQLTGATGDAR